MEPISRREALRRVGILMGGAISAPVVAGVLSGCRADPSDSWAPSTLSADQNELVTTISEMIIPETDTPGARAAQVNRFIDTMLTDWHPEEAKQHFLSGLDVVNALCQEAFGQPFLECASEEQVRVLEKLDREAYASESTPPGEEDELAAEDLATQRATQKGGGRGLEEIDTNLLRDSISADRAGASPVEKTDQPPFFRMMKEMTLLGYYTSEIGATQELQWIAVPGRYDACVPLSEVGRAWA